ncbi:thiamine pyrophosphate-binding protein [Microvirga puerhi]|uniref:Thiamine pyrophosphate-binding protein n=1 Tax=Microvirga puerhi TaxID=2876078 RepID=A0ABS7VQI3_9HYPH|nr:thiamine pyrophosphate-binding protein [Microvirga puerhi]MBZ6077818.1 thiamine pyrophosphate-binding protein [Microvirga puerhi]
MTAPSRTGGQILVDQLLVHGVDHIFCVPGESYLAALDALHDADIKVTVCRQEGGAAMMAEAHGKLTGRPGICFVTRGPGATNASPGLHIAKQDSTPMILFVGQIERGMREREAFQELDYRAVFGPMVKWATEVDDPARFPELVSRAFHIATSGRPGPVVIALPEDVLTETAIVADAPPYKVIESHPAPEQMAELQDLLHKAERPMVLLGGSRWSKEAVADFARFAGDFKLPIACTFRRQMLFSADHPSYAGDLGLGVNPKLLERIKSADLVLLVGGRLSEIPSQAYTLLNIPAPRQKLVHIHPDSSELGRVYSPHLAINASPTAFASALKTLKAPGTIHWGAETETAHASYLAWSDPSKIHHPGQLQMGEVMAHLRKMLPTDTIFCNGAGNFATWIHRFWPFRHYGTQLAPTSGSMGYGVPAAVGAKRVQPNSPVVVFAGDGDFLMNGQEFATAVQYDLPILIILIDNGMYGTIRMHQEREYPGRVSATMLKNPDFAAYAKAFGGYGERVETTEEFAPALERALTSSKPAILHCILDPEAITPAMSLSAIREKALASRT